MNSKTSNPYRGALAAAALTLATIVPAGAQLAGQLGVLDLTANGGINPATDAPWAEGDTYRLVFVTSATTQATSTNISTYNAFVQEAAASSTAFPKLGIGLWKIVGSTATVDARTNTGTNPAFDTGVPVFLMDGATPIALNNADLWDGIAVAVNFDENNDLLNEDRAFTGTLPNGTRVTGTGDQPLGGTSGNIRTGRSDNLNWMTDFSNPATNFNSVFAMSDPLTVVDLSDTAAPNLISIEDDQEGGPVEVPRSIIYTVTFDKPMSAGSVGVADFENASGTVVTIHSVSPTANPAVYDVAVTALQAGTLQLQIKQDAVLVDLPGNALDTSSALPDTTTITLSEDLTDPTLVSISDHVGGGPIVATASMTPRYTVTFSEPIDPATMGPDDFENGSSAPITINSVSPTGNPAVFEVVVTTSGPGELVLQIRAGAVIEDLVGNRLDTSSALPDVTTITVNPVPAIIGELGVFDVVNANGGINPVTALPWAEGDTYRLAFITSQTITGESTDIATYNAFVQGLADAAGLGQVSWKVIASTETVAARDNTSTNPLVNGEGEPIVLMDGVTIIAADYNDLWNGVGNTLGLDEYAQPLVSDRVLTGSSTSGTQAPDGRVLGGSSEDPKRVMTGRNDVAGTGWMVNFNVETTSARPVFALSEPLFIIPATGGPRITSFNPVGGAVWELSLLGRPNTAYEFRSSTVLDFNPGTRVDSLTEAGPGVVTAGRLVTTDDNGDATVRLTLAGHPSDFVRAQIPPPPLSENFDAAATLPEGWVSTPSNGTAWEVGTPGGVDSGPAAASSPPNSVGTNINGYYTANADATLTSPTITIPAGRSATLKFMQFIDTDLASIDGDFGSVRILDADNADTPIPGLGITNIEGDGTAGWTQQTLALPAEDVGGRNIKVQFRFVSNAGTVQERDVWSGFYVDDVTVTVP